jgi:hypothetical protein
MVDQFRFHRANDRHPVIFGHKKTSFDNSKQAWYDDLAYGPESRILIGSRERGSFYLVSYVQILADEPQQVNPASHLNCPLSSL